MFLGAGASAVAAMPGAARPWNPIEGGGRWAELAPAAPADAPLRAGFGSVRGAESGLGFTNRFDELAGAANRVLENGSGVAAGDYDGDGRPDLFLASLSGASALFRNLGAWRFTNVTAAAGLSLDGEVARGAVFADLDGDGRPDLLVSTLARGVRCFLNAGDGRFREATAGSGLDDLAGATTMALADVDGNGTPDLYVARYRAEDIRDSSNVEARVVNGRTVLHPKYEGRLFIGPPGLLEYGEPDALFLNDGRAHFSRVPWTGGAFVDESGRPLGGPPRDWGLTASFRDINGDGHPDLYVCNDYWTPDRIWLNTGRGGYRAASREAIRHTSENSMGVDFADVDRDGQVDVLVLDMLSRDLRRRRRQVLAQTPVPAAPGESLNRPQFMRNTLFRNRGDGTFAELADYAGLAASDWSWQPLFLDADLDGFEDVLVSAGHRKDVQDLDATERIQALQRPLPGNLDPEARQRAHTRRVWEHGRLYPDLGMPVVAFRNAGDFRFTEVTANWGFDRVAVHQGMAAADLDGDGDLDLVVNVLGGEAGLYRNDAVAPRVAVRLRGLAPNTEGTGARVRLKGGAVPIQGQEMVSGGRYLSGCEPLLVFAAGTNPAPALSLEVTWRNGRVSEVGGVLPGRIYEVDEASARPATTPATPARETWFEDVSGRLGSRHAEDGFDDFAVQPLLPWRLSQEGPGVAWADLNGDGLDDLVVGTGAGGRAGVFTNDARGGFAAAPGWFPETPAPADLAGFAVWRDSHGRTRILAGHAENTTDGTPVPVLTEHGPGGGDPGIVLPPDPHLPGPVAMADVDGDGDLDAFVGGRRVSGRYPESAHSRLLLREGDRWILDEAGAELWRGLGLVQDAAWGDFDDDGDPDLVVAAEWSPLRLWLNQDGRFHEATAEWGLSGHSGLWCGVTVGDVDGDGRLDVVASNRGLNSPDAASPSRPLVLLYGDFLGRGVVDVLETEWDPVRGVLGPRPRLDLAASALPPLRRAFPTHRAYSEASVADLEKVLAPPVHRRQADTLASMVFLGRGRGFEARPLPPDAQWAPATAIRVADFDGDGIPDLFASQNAFAFPPRSARIDAGFGLWLRGTGGGRWEAVGAAASGIRVAGDQRAAAVSDFDGDGRPDLVVTQNGGETRLFRNRRGIPGLRVRLRGGAMNPEGVGAVVQGVFGERRGPLLPVASGGGHWSLDSAAVVVGGPGGSRPTSLRVRWPGGRVVEGRVPAGALEVHVDLSGTLHRVR